MASTLEFVSSATEEVTVMDMVWASFNEVVWFTAGVLVFRLALRMKLLPAFMGPSWLVGEIKASRAKQKHYETKVKAVTCQTSAKICAASEAGDCKAVLASWHEEHRASTPAALEAVASALVRLEPDVVVEQLVDFLAGNADFAKPATVQAIVMSMLRQRRPDLAQEFIEAVQAAKHHGLVSLKTREQVLGGFAAQGLADDVSRLLVRVEEDLEQWCSGANSAVRGFLVGKHASLALRLVEDMRQRGSALQDKSIAALLDAASSANEVSMPEVLEKLNGMTLPPEACAMAMTACLKTQDLATARCLEEHLREHQPQLPFAVLEPLLKLAAKHDEQMALKLLREMQDQNMFLSEGLFGLILSRCGESRHLELAEAVQQHLRDCKMTSLATYKTLMKVYATCDLLDRACELYEDICADGIVPDSVMYGCLVKFAVKCGREELSERLLQAVAGQPQDAQNYVWLIRAAGQKQDVDRAISLLRQFQASKNDEVGASVFNCVLDVCMTNSKFDEAETLVAEMHEKKISTLVTYNTLMKGYAANGDFRRARLVLSKMKTSGFQPDQASFNCLISAAVSAGDTAQVWSIFEEMQNARLEADSFTLAILMKLVRKSNSRRDTQRALAVLDKSTVDICKDDVLLNTVLDACIHLKDKWRLSWMVEQIERTQMTPSVQNYGLIIKAYSCLKRTDKCWSVWKRMTEVQELVPSDVAMSCMLDAVMSAGQTQDGLALFRKWQSVVSPNTIIYSNLIKGFASIGDADGAMEMYRELKSHGLQMNIVAYSTLIDAHAKSGNPEKAQELLNQMEKDGCAPNTITYSCLLKAHCVKGDLDSGLRVFEDMISKGLKPDTVVFNTLLDGAVRCGQFNLCDQLVREMSTYGVETSNFTLSIIVKMWGKRRKLEQAFTAVREAIEAGCLQLDSKLCTCLISACFHNQQPKRALEALEEMKSWSRCDGPDNGTYEQLIDSLLRNGLFKDAAQVAVEATDLALQGSIKWVSAGHLRQLCKVLQQKGIAKDLLHNLQGKLQAA